MLNPFEAISNQLNGISEVLSTLQIAPAAPPPEIVDRPELRQRLKLTEPTIIRLEKKGVIPAIRLGGSVRYNWPKVVEALENASATKKYSRILS